METNTEFVAEAPKKIDKRSKEYRAMKEAKAATEQPVAQTEVKAKVIKHKMWEVTVSGSFKTNVASDKDRVQFSGIKGLVPFCDEEYIFSCSYPCRMFPLWLEADKNYNQNYEGFIKIRVDDYKEAEGVNPCIGKDIKEMTWAELQWLACYKNIRTIPRYHQGDLRVARERAYLAYEKEVNGRKVFKNAKEIRVYREDMERKGREPQEIEELISKGLSLIVDQSNPGKSYSFAKLPGIIVE